MCIWLQKTIVYIFPQIVEDLAVFLDCIFTMNQHWHGWKMKAKSYGQNQGGDSFGELCSLRQCLRYCVPFGCISLCLSVFLSCFSIFCCYCFSLGHHLYSIKFTHFKCSLICLCNCTTSWLSRQNSY